MQTRIKLARGSDSSISSKTSVSTLGHPIFNTDKKYLYIGDGQTKINSLAPVTSNRLVGWSDYANSTTANYHVWGAADGLFLGSNGVNGINFFSSTSGAGNTNLLQLTQNQITSNRHIVTPSINTTTLNSRNISDIFEIDSPKVKSATLADYYKTTLETKSGSSVTIASMLPSYYYKCADAVTTLTIQALSAPTILNTVGEYFIKFTTGGSSPSISIPTGVSYANGWNSTYWATNTSYLIYIIDNMAFVSVI